MNSRTKLGIAVVAALIIGVGGYFGWGNFSMPSSGQEAQTKLVSTEKFGVLESMRAVKAHPRYGEIEALEREIKELQQTMQAKLERGKMMTMSQGLPMAVSQSMTAGQQALYAEANQKLAAKETELNKRLAEADLAKRKAASEEFAKLRGQITEEYKLPIFNIKLKLETLKISDEERASLEKQMQSLKQEEDSKLGAAYQAIARKMTEEMMAEQKAASEEMQAYMQQIGEEYSLMTSAKTGQPNEAMMAEINELNRKLKADIEASEKVYNEKREQQEEIKSMILKDIRAEVERIAIEEGLTIVLSDVRANVTALDITDKVIEACKKQEQQ